jgi:uncharacterized protein YicC (UPF0701 family)
MKINIEDEKNNVTKYVEKTDIENCKCFDFFVYDNVLYYLTIIKNLKTIKVENIDYIENDNIYYKNTLREFYTLDKQYQKKCFITTLLNLNYLYNLDGFYAFRHNDFKIEKIKGKILKIYDDYIDDYIKHKSKKILEIQKRIGLYTNINVGMHDLDIKCKNIIKLKS